MHDRAKCKTIVPRATEVRDVDVPVANGFVLAPLEKSVAPGAAVFNEAAKWIFAVRQICHAAAPYEVDRFGVQG